jgi:hypothetical protein
VSVSPRTRNAETVSLPAFTAMTASESTTGSPTY